MYGSEVRESAKVGSVAVVYVNGSGTRSQASKPLQRRAWGGRYNPVGCG